jgi:hypothetical protein
MRNALLALLAGCLLAPLGQSVAKPSRRQLREYRHRLYGAQAVGGSAATAAIGTLRNRPHEWGGGPGGFAKRFASHLGQHAVKETIQLGVATWRHEDLHYHRSNLHGTWPRMKYALVSTFIVPKTNRPGKKTVALGRISGNLGGGLISRAWQPASAAGVGAGLARGGIGLGAEVGVNMAREFWPRKHERMRKLISHSHAAAHSPS